MLDYDQHATLVLSAVTSYDSQFVCLSTRSTRQFYSTELGSSDFELNSPSEVTEDLDYDVNTSLTMLLEKNE